MSVRSSPKPSGSDSAGRLAVRRGIQSVEKGTVLLRTLMAATGPLSLKQLSGATALSPSTTHRYLTSYVRSGLVSQDRRTGDYDLGPFAVRLGFAALNRLDPIQIADSSMSTFVEQTGCTAFVSVWSEYGPMIVRYQFGTRGMGTYLGIGSKMPVLTSATGLIFLAYLPAAIVKPFIDIELQDATLEPRNTGEVAARAEEIRQLGYAFIDGNIFRGRRAVAAPIFDHQNRLHGALTALGFEPNVDKARNRAVAALIKTAHRISEDLGHQRPAARPVRRGRS